MKWSTIVNKTKSLSIEDCKTLMAENPAGSYLLIDVRQPNEYARMHVPGAISMPLPDLVEGNIALPEAKPLIIYSRKGQRSQAAAQWFSAEEFTEVYQMEGGFEAWNGNKAYGQFELNLNLVKEDVDFPDALSMAFAMEEGLRQFYLAIARETQEEFYVKLYRKLASFEVEHKQSLAQAYSITEGKALIDTELEKRQEQIMEGGNVTDETLIKTLANTSSVEDVFGMAIAFETQAYDFYVRAAAHVTRPEAKTFFLEMADAEKEHLAFVTTEMNNYLNKSDQ